MYYVIGREGVTLVGTDQIHVRFVSLSLTFQHAMMPLRFPIVGTAVPHVIVLVGVRIDGTLTNTIANEYKGNDDVSKKKSTKCIILRRVN